MKAFENRRGFKQLNISSLPNAHKIPNCQLSGFKLKYKQKNICKISLKRTSEKYKSIYGGTIRNRQICCKFQNKVSKLFTYNTFTCK